MTPYRFSIAAALALSASAAATAQTFPYDLDRSGEEQAVSDFLVVYNLQDHLAYFGSDTVAVEVYLNENSFFKYPPSTHLNYATTCVRTLFLQATTAAGTFHLPVTRRTGTYHVFFFRGGCFFEYTIDLQPDGTWSKNWKAWGDCAPAPGTKRT